MPTVEAQGFLDSGLESLSGSPTPTDATRIFQPSVAASATIPTVISNQRLALTDDRKILDEHHVVSNGKQYYQLPNLSANCVESVELSSQQELSQEIDVLSLENRGEYLDDSVDHRRRMDRSAEMMIRTVLEWRTRHQVPRLRRKFQNPKLGRMF